MRSGRRIPAALWLGFAPLLAGMAASLGAQPAGTPDDAGATPLPAAPRAPAPVEVQHLGPPYMVDGVLHAPAPVAALDEVGYATLLFETAQGRLTASGEPYVADAITAAHRTLPLPAYVEVTSLESGRTILVRVNDRGPLLNDRVIALSQGAARQLGLSAVDGTAPVRVRMVRPSEPDRAVLLAGRLAPERIETPPGLRTALARRLPPRPLPLAGPVRTLGADLRQATSAPQSTPAPTPAPQSHSEPGPVTAPAARAATLPAPSAATSRPTAPPQARAAGPKRAGAAPSGACHVVQVAALSSRARAEALARALDGFVEPAGALFRVRIGPFAAEAQARAALARVHAKGYAEARLMANDGH